MMEDLLGVDYTMDEIREVTGAQPSSEEVYVVQPLVGNQKFPKLVMGMSTLLPELIH
jgi:hypothetical protein